MGSKTPPPHKLSQAAALGEVVSRRFASSNEAQASRTLRRIAEALQVPPSTLYNPPNAVSPASASQSGNSPVALNVSVDGEHLMLLRACQRVRDPEKRRCLLALVQEAAKQS